MHTSTIWYLLGAFLLAGCGAADTPDQAAFPADDTTATRSDFFQDVTATHLPAGVTDGFSMDARFTDLDADGDADLVVACEFCRNLLLLNDGTGRFTDARDRFPATERDSEDVGIADFDGDGDLDVVLVSEDDEVNELYLNDGTGRFTDASDRLPVTSVSNALVVADVDGDGTPDLLIGNNGQNRLLLNDGAARFTDATAEHLPARADVTQDLELGDADGDGDLDLIVGNEDANRLLLNDGTGRFTDAPEGALPLRATPEETREADFGDVDGDGDLDLFFANIGFFVDGADPQDRLLLNNGQGRFTDVTTSQLPADSDQTFDGDFIDLDGDGDLDLIVGTMADVRGERADAPYRAYQNDGNGLFLDATATLLPATALGNGFDIEAADVDGDGRLDLYLASRGGTDRLLLAR